MGECVAATSCTLAWLCNTLVIASSGCRIARCQRGCRWLSISSNNIITWFDQSRFWRSALRVCSSPDHMSMYASPRTRRTPAEAWTIGTASA